MKQIGKKILEATGEKLSTFYLMQSISINTKRTSTGLDGLFNFHIQELEMP